MRRIIFSLSVSVDGYFASPDGGLAWHRVDEELHAHFNEKFAVMGAFLEGRVTYELMESYWPTADDDPAATTVEKEFAAIWRGMPKIVFSRTLEQVGPGARIERDVDVERIAALKAEPGGDLVVGGPDLAATFRELDLIDEYHLYVHPVLIGRGLPIFRPTDVSADLRLVETRSFGNGVVMLRHERVRD